MSKYITFYLIQAILGVWQLSPLKQSPCCNKPNNKIIHHELVRLDKISKVIDLAAHIALQNFQGLSKDTFMNINAHCREQSSRCQFL